MGKCKRLVSPKGMPFMPPKWLIKLSLILGIQFPLKPPFDKPGNWENLSPEEKRKLRFENWICGKNIKFINQEAKISYKERCELIRDAFDINKCPRRIPVFIITGIYALSRFGLTPMDAFYRKWKKAAIAHTRFYMDFKPDASMIAQMFSVSLY